MVRELWLWDGPRAVPAVPGFAVSAARPEDIPMRWVSLVALWPVKSWCPAPSRTLLSGCGRNSPTRRHFPPLPGCVKRTLYGRLFPPSVRVRVWLGLQHGAATELTDRTRFRVSVLRSFSRYARGLLLASASPCRVTPAALDGFCLLGRHRRHVLSLSCAGLESAVPPRALGQGLPAQSWWRGPASPARPAKARGMELRESVSTTRP